MKIILDDCTQNLGWIHQDLANSTEVTTWTHLASSGYKSQLLFRFINPSIAYIDYSSPIDTQNLDNIALSIKCNKTIVPKALTDYGLKIKFYQDQFTFTEFLMEVNQSFEQYTFRNPHKSISRIEIEALVPIQFFISDIILFHDDIPIDLFEGVKYHILQYIDRKAVKIGTLSGTKGSNTAQVSHTTYLDKYQCIILENGDIHQIISDVSTRSISFGNEYGLSTLSSDFEDIPFYLYFPIEFTANENDPYIAGISISGFDQEILEEQEEYSPIIDSIELSGQVRMGLVGSTWKHTIIVEGMARHDEVLEMLRLIFTKSFNKKTIIYLNGRRHELNCTTIENPDYGDATDIINKITVTCTVDITEESWERNLQTMDFQTINQTVSGITI